MCDALLTGCVRGYWSDRRGIFKCCYSTVGIRDKMPEVADGTVSPNTIRKYLRAEMSGTQLPDANAAKQARSVCGETIWRKLVMEVHKSGPAHGKTDACDLVKLGGGSAPGVRCICTWKAVSGTVNWTGNICAVGVSARRGVPVRLDVRPLSAVSRSSFRSLCRRTKNAQRHR
jgi:hypothetical protein